MKAEPTECSSEDGITIGILDTICTMIHLLKSRSVPETGAIGEALEDARSAIRRCSLLTVPSVQDVQTRADLDLLHEAAERVRALEAGAPRYGTQEWCAALDLNNPEQRRQYEEYMQDSEFRPEA